MSIEKNNGRRVTLADVAKMAGVSKQTASRVVNDSAHVTEETRARVLKCIDTLGFRPSAIARQLTSGRSYTLGVVSNAAIGFLTSGDAYTGMVREADTLGYALLIKEMREFSASSVEVMLNHLMERQVDGVIWAGPEIGDSHAWLKDYPVADLPMPLVVVNALPIPNVDMVGFDNFQAGKTATEHLVSLGRRKIGHIAGPLSRSVASLRVDGWREALDEAGLSACKDYCVEGNWEAVSGGPALRQLLEMCPDLDAVFVSSDRMALGVLFEAQRMGLKVPQDLAVMGLDNDPQSAFFSPSLTTMKQDTPKMAEIALRLLVRRICERRGEAYPPSCAVAEDPILKHEIVARESTLGAAAGQTE